MEGNDLKSLWQNAQDKNNGNISDNAGIERTINLNHSKNISKILADVKMKILVSAIILVIYTGLMIYAFIYLGLHLSGYALILFMLSGLFLIFITTSGIIRLSLLTKTADNMSVKESLLSFRKRLNRIRSFDFLTYLVMLYLSAILIIYNYISDIGGIENLSWDKGILPLPLIVLFILILLLCPWFIRYQHNQRYKKLYANLKDSMDLLK
jgi:hypothetical protein